MLFSIIQFIKYYFVSITKYKVHSPFVFTFIKEILEKNIDGNKKAQIINLLNMYKNHNYHISNEDYGAGSKLTNKNNLSIKHLLKNVSTSKKYGKILYNLVNYYKYNNCIELGSSLGFGTTYLSTSTNNVISIEGNKDLVKIASENIARIGLTNASIINDVFDNVLEEVLKKNKFDLLFIDGNHKEEATLKYFDIALKHKSNNSVIIMDDINWSKGMNNAWNKIISNKEITLSIDLFKFGIVFFNPNIVKKEHFVLWY